MDAVPRPEALAALREMAGGSTDVLVEAGATEAGCWYGSPDTTGIQLATAGLLLSAGVRVEREVVARWVEVGYKRTKLGGPMLAR